MENLENMIIANDDSNMESVRPQRERIVSFDLIRVVSMFLVATIHSMGASHSKMFDSVIDVFQVSAVSLFIMVSGALVLRSTTTVSSFFKNRLVGVFLPFIFWSTVVSVIKIKQGGVPSIANVIHNFFTGNVHGIYWFMYMLFGLYLLVPVLSRFVSSGSRSEHRYAFFMFGIMYTVGCIFPTLAFKTLISGQFVALFYAGLYLSAYRPSLTPKWWFLLVMTFGSSVWIVKNVIHATFPSGISSSIMAMLLFCAIMSCERLLQGKLLKRFLDIGSRYSFGIYLTHFMFISVLEKIGLYSLPISSCILVPLIALSAILLSFLFLATINRIPYLSKVIGVR